MDKLKITVLHGGPGSERDVSLDGGKAVAAALAGLGHDVELADILPDDLRALDRPGVDVVFPVLHGVWGEDGQLQRLLEQRGLVYPGSGPEASQLAMNKAATKAELAAAGLPTPGWQVLGEWPGRWDGKFPAVVKPVDQGSSVDLTIAKNLDQFRQAVENVCAKYGRCLVEQFIRGRELTVGILDDAALAPIEIVVHGHEYYDYNAKYNDDATEYLVVPKLPGRMSEQLREQALAAHRAIGCRDFSRVDFMLRQDGRPFILEINTIPGFTSHSLLPKAAANAGLDFAALCQRLVDLALRRAMARRLAV